MIELKNVSKFYSNNGTVSLGLKNVNLKLNTNEIVAICGESGSGKSTLLNVISKIDTFDEGEIYIDQEETSYFDISDMDNFRKNKVGFIFQTYNIIESYDVLHNVMMPLIVNGVSEKEAKKRALELIKKVGLGKRIHNKGSHLSGGEKQRCVIARALASNCEILACDEPTGNLDSKTSAEIINLIKEVAKDKIVLIVTHNFEEVKNIVNRKITLKDGEIISDETFVKVEDDHKQFIENENLKVNNKSLLKIANFNLRFTPRKTIFVSLVFILISFVVLNVITAINESTHSMRVDNSFASRIENSIYIENTCGKEIDIEFLDNNFSDKYVSNPMETLYPSYSQIGNIFTSVIYEKSYGEKDLKTGRMPEKDDEVCINVNSNYNIDDINSLIGKTVNLYYLNNTYKSFKICGASNTSSTYYSALFGNQNVANYIKYHKYNLNFNIKNDQMSQYVMATVIYNKDCTNTIHVGEYLKEYTDLEIINSYFENQSSHFKKNVDLNNINIEYDLGENERSYIEVNESFDLGFIESALIYDVDCGRSINLANNYGYLAVAPSSYSTNNSILDFLNNGEVYAMIFLVFIAAIGFFFITYAILRIAYASRKGDYNIIRTLGVTNKYMKYIVIYELLILGIIWSLALYLVIFVLTKNISNIYIDGFAKLNVIHFVAYEILILLLCYLIAVRFNKRLFKFSVRTQFEGRSK